jgi:ankyrin repeat protein
MEDLFSSDSDDEVARVDDKVTIKTHKGNIEGIVIKVSSKGTVKLNNYKRYSKVVRNISRRRFNKLKEDSETPLCVAAANNEQEDVKLLLDYGESACDDDENGHTPLFLAAWQTDNPQIVKLLLDNDISCLNTGNLIGVTPLMEAARFGANNIVKMLLLYDPNVSQRDNEGKTALQYAIDEDFKICAALLRKHVVKKTAEIELKYRGLTFLEIVIEVIQLKDLESTNILLDFLLDVPFRLPTPSLGNILHLVATYFNNGPLMSFLLSGERIKRINQQDTVGNTPLIKAAMYGNTRVIMILLKNSADATIKNNRNETAYDVAQRLNNLAVMKFLGRSRKSKCGKTNKELSLIGTPTEIIFSLDQETIYKWKDGRTVIVKPDGREYIGELLVMNNFIRGRSVKTTTQRLQVEGDEDRLYLAWVFLGPGTHICTLAAASVLYAVLDSMNRDDIYAPNGEVLIQSNYPCAAFNCYNRAFLMNGYKLKNGEYNKISKLLNESSIDDAIYFYNERQALKKRTQKTIENIAVLGPLDYKLKL